MQRGWAPKTEKMKAAMNEDKSTSDTPYCCVVSMRSNENAIPGNTLDWARPPLRLVVMLLMILDTYFAKKIRTTAGITL